MQTMSYFQTLKNIMQTPYLFWDPHFSLMAAYVVAFTKCDYAMVANPDPMLPEAKKQVHLKNFTEKMELINAQPSVEAAWAISTKPDGTIYEIAQKCGMTTDALKAQMLTLTAYVPKGSGRVAKL